ncbi:hypothetical protein GCM10010274_27150 [Streptomyces lavendofoliae]|uniref:Uncharacterized protein n=1 Tax=Streptomyces lavendofoliae TaxID=67314 RepID=A0A918HWX9_9ACTN|nr:hypothetical protein GCM10010274_27150 [Streptomyces lavendofoliae]
MAEAGPSGAEPGPAPDGRSRLAHPARGPLLDPGAGSRPSHQGLRRRAFTVGAETRPTGPVRSLRPLPAQRAGRQLRPEPAPKPRDTCRRRWGRPTVRRPVIAPRRQGLVRTTSRWVARVIAT